jgi:hypothetical protein
LERKNVQNRCKRGRRGAQTFGAARDRTSRARPARRDTSGVSVTCRWASPGRQVSTLGGPALSFRLCGLAHRRQLSTSGYPPYLHAGQGLTLSQPVAFGTETSYTSRHLTNADCESRLTDRLRRFGEEPSITSGARGAGMNLVACEAPVGALYAAPPTAMRQDSSTERWTGFWGTDDRYYARCATTSGEVAWFCFADEVGGLRQPEQQPEPVTIRALSAPRRRTLLFRVGRSASHGCVFGVRRPTSRATALRA